MALLKRKQTKTRSQKPLEVQTRPAELPPLFDYFGYTPTDECCMALYDAMRNSIPIIDAALQKVQRLIGGFRFNCSDKKAEKALRTFAETVRVGPSLIGLEHFVCQYLDSMLLYGNAVGEVILDSDGKVAGLYNANLSDVLLKPGKDPMSVVICRKDNAGNSVPTENPNLILFSALNPRPGRVRGESILHGLPFVSSILMKVYHAVGTNFDRIGNVRFAVTYRPGDSGYDKAYARERAQQIAKEWSEGMAASRHGDIRDFVAVGDIDVKVIGAENQMIDCEIPARQMLEQIIAKLSIPPFMLGVSWSTTERMSQQQAQVLSSELAYYRRLIQPILHRIALTFLYTEGYFCTPEIEWDILNFEDEINAAQARLYNAQATKIELESGEKPQPIPVDISAEQ